MTQVERRRAIKSLVETQNSTMGTQTKICHVGQQTHLQVVGSGYSQDELPIVVRD